MEQVGHTCASTCCCARSPACTWLTLRVGCLSDGSENVTSLDLSDFPALADRSRRDGGSNPTPLPNPLAGRAPYGENRRGAVGVASWFSLTGLFLVSSPVGMVTKPSSEQSQDFSIHNEDFPALPGPNYQIKEPSSSSSSSEDKTVRRSILPSPW